MKRQVCFSVLVLIFFRLAGQDAYRARLEPSAKSIDKRERKLLSEFKKKGDCRSAEDPGFFFVYSYDLKVRPAPELFLKGTVLEELELPYWKGSHFPTSDAIIFDQKGSYLEKFQISFLELKLLMFSAPLLIIILISMMIGNFWVIYCGSGPTGYSAYMLRWGLLFIVWWDLLFILPGKTRK